MLRAVLVLLSLLAASLWVYAGTLGFGFVEFDDDQLVVANPGVRLGLSAEGLRWALTTFHTANWTPLSWISYQLDHQVAGLDPRHFHAVNAALHAANALLVFGVLRGMTGALWRSALVAGLLALHPIHVESVAWVSERRDVLSGLFGWLAIGAWVGYARRGGAGRHVLALALAGLALLSKPSWVTLPALLLLLDFWPLRRLASDAGSPLPAGLRKTLPALLVEKVPLALLCLGTGVMAILAQTHGGAAQFSQQIPLHLRAANALVSYAVYLGRALWPSGLSPLYPHPYLPGGEPWSALEIAGAALLLAGVTVLVGLARERRYLAVGWLWFGLALLPMIGLFQVGTQATADRYAYLPFVGLYVAVAWGLGDLLAGRGRALRAAAAALCGVWLAGLGVAARAQTQHWRDTLALCERAVAVSPSPEMLYNLANQMKRRRQTERAIELYRRSVELYPDHAAAHHNLGNALRGVGELDLALHHYREAMRAAPLWGRSGGVDIAAWAERALRQTQARKQALEDRGAR